MKRTEAEETQSPNPSATASHDPASVHDGYTTVYPAKADGVAPSTSSFGDYEILGQIASGGMGVVYRARERRLNRIVALKMIRSSEFADSEQIRRFYTKAEAAASLDHPNIVPVYEVGEWNGQHYYTMAFVEGRSLHSHVSSDGPMTPTSAAELTKAVVEAVQFAHHRGIIHRDIKPQNVLLEATGTPRVADFGLAKQIHKGSDLTEDGQVLGTPSYMPPEQAAGKLDQVGTSSDIYSLGAMLYYLLTGRPPFQSASVVETIRQVLDAEPASIRSLNQGVPRDLETICMKCLQKGQAQRYISAGDLADDLERWLRHEPIKARRVSLAVQ